MKNLPIYYTKGIYDYLFLTKFEEFIYYMQNLPTSIYFVKNLRIYFLQSVKNLSIYYKESKNLPFCYLQKVDCEEFICLSCDD